MKQQLQKYFKGNFQKFYGKYLPETKAIGGDEFQALCPFHDDSNPSFNFNSQTGAYFCHGCGKKGDFIHFYGKINSLNTRSDFPKILEGIAKDFGIIAEKKKSRIIEIYDYVDEKGALLFQVCRMDPKDFRQRHRNGNGKWTWNLKGVRRVIYRLPEVIKADEVIVVEGEKDTDNLYKLGLVATTCPMGAKKWRDEYNLNLKAKDVILIPDNDNEGREHMQRVATSLNGIAKSLKWIDLSGLPSKGDVSDFISKYDDPEAAAERLSIMISEADPYEPPKKLSLEDIVMDAGQFLEIDLPEKAQLLYPWLKGPSMNLIVGDRGMGKTFFGLGILDAITKGGTFGPWECKNPIPCLFLDGEMPPQDIVERINNLNLNSERKNPIHIYSDAYANLHGLPRAHLANESWRVKMKSILIAKKVKLWVVDNLASLASGLDENSKKDWDPINSWLLELRFAGISTIMMHHTGKGGAQRGTSAREDNLDISIKLKAPHDYVPEDGARFIVHFTKARVSTKDLKLVADTEFKLGQEESSKYSWTYKNVRKENKRAVLELIAEGMDQKTIGELLNLSKGYVSKIKKSLISDGFVSKKGAITQSGFHALHGP